MDNFLRLAMGLLAGRDAQVVMNEIEAERKSDEQDNEEQNEK